MKRNLFKRQGGSDRLEVALEQEKRGPVGNSAEGNEEFTSKATRRRSRFGDAMTGRHGLFALSPAASSRSHRARELSRGRSWTRENGFCMERTEAAQRMRVESKELLRRSSFDMTDSKEARAMQENLL